ncbi:MAG: hypothetical protein JNM56_26045 [Planctomycetia bacterium]|nr:hypothetical protein [Planctomycetia bacterium]
MTLVIDPQGLARCLYSEALDLSALGMLSIRRASHVEPDATGQWWVDLAPVHGPQFGPYHRRADALGAEQAWLEANILLIAAT